LTQQSNLRREDQEGNTEYKLKISSLGRERLEELASQMKYRLNEGGGEAFYELGVSDEGELIGLPGEELAKTLDNLREVGRTIGASCTVLREAPGKTGKVLEVLVRRNPVNGSLPVYLTVPMLGNVDAGKSTIVGVLTCGELDDGNGRAMSKVARHLHEIRMRRTSSISYRLIGFDHAGGVVNYRMVSPLDEAEVFLNSSKVISFVDLAGHERYLRTTLKGVLGHEPDYAMVVIGANMGVIGTTKEHVGIAVALHIPFFVVVTKIDMVSAKMVDAVCGDVQRLVKMPGINKVPASIDTRDDAVVVAKNMPVERICPIFRLSNTTGEGLEALTTFLNLLPQRQRWKERIEKPFLLYVDDKFRITGVGTVVSGMIQQGSVEEDERVRIGPFHDGGFRTTRIKSIQINRVPIQRAEAGPDTAFALADISYNDVRKGMVLLSTSLEPVATTTFDADVLILHHPTTIRKGYHAVAHIQTVRQTVEFVEMSKEPLRTGDHATVRMRFLFRPEYLVEGQKLVFREGRTKGVGTIRTIHAS
jgi:elongation factor 1-alpha